MGFGDLANACAQYCCIQWKTKLSCDMQGFRSWFLETLEMPVPPSRTAGPTVRVTFISRKPFGKKHRVVRYAQPPLCVQGDVFFSKELQCARAHAVCNRVAHDPVEWELEVDHLSLDKREKVV